MCQGNGFSSSPLLRTDHCYSGRADPQGSKAWKRREERRARDQWPCSPIRMPAQKSTGQVTTATLCIFRLAGFRGGVAPGYCTHARITHDTMSILLFAMLVMLAIMLAALQPAACTVHLLTCARVGAYKMGTFLYFVPFSSPSPIPPQGAQTPT